MIELLKYPKNLFNKSDILKEIGKFDYPKAWELKEDSQNYYLKLNTMLLNKNYSTKGGIRWKNL